MNRYAVNAFLAFLLAAGCGAALACDYVQGETHYADWAKCRYGNDAIVVVDLPESNGWDQCIYQVEAFRPGKLLAVTRDEDGKEVVSTNDRSQMGNPCYLTKKSCDAALGKLKESGAY